MEWNVCLASEKLSVQVPAPENKRNTPFLKTEVELKPAALNVVTIA